jgi:hypothetical protein
LVTANNWAELKSHCEAGGVEISLSESFVGDAASYPGQIDFSGSVCVVQGNGKILDAGGAGRFFYGKGEGSSLIVHSLTLKNGKESGGGGAIQASGVNVEIHTSSFITNEAAQGGAIAAYSSNVEIHDSTFQSNTAPYGGAPSAAPLPRSSLIVHSLALKNGKSLVSLCLSLYAYYFSAPSEQFLPKKHLNFSLTGRCSLNLLTLLGLRKNLVQGKMVSVSFRLHEFSPKRPISKCRSNSWPGTCNY